MVVREDNDDKMIVMQGIELVQQIQHSTMVADNTYILVMLLHMWDLSMSDVALRHEVRNCIKKIWSLSILRIPSLKYQNTKICCSFMHGVIVT